MSITADAGDHLDRGDIGELARPRGCLCSAGWIIGHAC